MRGLFCVLGIKKEALNPRTSPDLNVIQLQVLILMEIPVFHVLLEDFPSIRMESSIRSSGMLAGTSFNGYSALSRYQWYSAGCGQDKRHETIFHTRACNYTLGAASNRKVHG